MFVNTFTRKKFLFGLKYFRNCKLPTKFFILFNFAHGTDPWKHFTVTVIHQKFYQREFHENVINFFLFLQNHVHLIFDILQLTCQVYILKSALLWLLEHLSFFHDGIKIHASNNLIIISNVIVDLCMYICISVCHLINNIYFCSMKHLK